MISLPCAIMQSQKGSIKMGVQVKGWLSTHVLDLSSGNPAAGLKIKLHFYRASGPEMILETITNTDGRTDSPLLEGKQFTNGVYELSFDVGSYFRDQMKSLPGELFLNVVPIRFGVNNSMDHYHVPLLVSPYGYSTYRGS